jgi:long-chain acyl-CoA synthetase
MGASMPDTRTFPGSSDARPWFRVYPAGISWDMDVPPDTLVRMLDEAVATFGPRPCLEFLGRRWTYAQVGELVNRAAEGFRRLGVTHGARIGLCLPNSPYFVIAYFGSLKAGATVVNFNPLYVEEELAAQAADSGARIMVTIDLEPIFSRVRGLLDRGTVERVIACRFHRALPKLKAAAFRVAKRKMLTRVPDDDRRVVSFETLVSVPPITNPPDVRPGNLAVLQYTGGTTGTPKGVMLTHANLTANMRQVHAWFPSCRMGQERLLAVLPLFHVFAMTTAMNAALGWGAEIVLLPRFEIRQLLVTLRRCRPTVFPGVPTLYKAILDRGAKPSDLASVRVCISGGASLPLEVKRAFEAASGCTLVEGYGLTEAAPVCFCNPVEGDNRAGTIGLPLPGIEADIRSLEDPSQSCPIGERGELVVRGPNVMRGYWQRPKETASALTPDGWLRTGDVGIMDMDGYVTLVDRIKDLIICSGFNVYPRAIEEAIYRHPGVGAVTVLGMPDAYRGESVAAFVQPKPGAHLTEAELRLFLADKLSPIEMPRLIELRDNLPRTAVGKLSRKELRDELLQRQSPGAS